MKKLFIIAASIFIASATYSQCAIKYELKGEPIREGSIKVKEDGTFLQTVSIIVGIEGEPFGLSKVIMLDVELNGDMSLNEVYKVSADKGKLYEAALTYMKEHFEETK